MGLLKILLYFILGEGVEDMAIVYALLIVKGRKAYSRAGEIERSGQGCSYGHGSPGISGRVARPRRPETMRLPAGSIKREG